MPFKETKAFPGSPRPDVVVTKQQDPRPREHSVYTAWPCPASLVSSVTSTGARRWLIPTYSPTFVCTESLFASPLLSELHALPVSPNAHRGPKVMLDTTQIKQTCFWEETLQGGAVILCLCVPQFSG